MAPIVQGRSLGLSVRDHLLVFAAFGILSLVYTFPLVTALRTANRLDSPDAMLNGYIVSWCLHQLPRDPLHLFDAGIFFPERGALAYSENLVTGALLASPAALVSDSPILLFNVVLLLGFTTTGYATFLLAHDVTGKRLPALLAGILFAFAPYRFAHIPHLQLQLAFGIPMSLLFARRVVVGDAHGARSLGPIVGLAAATVLTFGSSVYYSVFVATALPIVVLFELGSVSPGRRLGAVARIGAAAILGALATLPLVLPYWEKLQEGTERPLAIAAGFSAGPLDYLSSFSRLHFFLPKTDEPLFAGVTALCLAGFALAATGGARATRRSYLTIAAVGVAVSMGPGLGLFTLLYRFLPAYHAIRVPSRAGVLFLLAIAILAAMGLARVRSPRLRLAFVAVASVECFCGPLSFQMREPALPPIYQEVRKLEGPGALVELPLPPPERFQDNAVYVYRSIFHRRPLVNGYSGFVPASYRRAFRDLVERELSGGLSRLESEGVRYLLAHEGRLGPRLSREIGEAVREGRLVRVAEQGPDRLYRLENVETAGRRGATAR